MQALLDFFAWLWSSIKAVFSFLTTAPAVIVASATGLITAVSSVKDVLINDNGLISAYTSPISSLSSSFLGYIDSMPDIFKLAMYSFSFDILFTGLAALLGLVLTASFAVFVFATVTLPSLVGIWLLARLAFWIAAAFVPEGYIPVGVKQIILPSAQDVKMLDGPPDYIDV